MLLRENAVKIKGAGDERFPESIMEAPTAAAPALGARDRIAWTNAPDCSWQHSASPGFLGPSYDPVSLGAAPARLLVQSGMAHQGFDLQLTPLLKLEPGGEDTGEHHEA